MMNDMTDKLSALMDGELRDPDKWLERLTKDNELRKTWQRYHVSRDVLKSQLSDFPALDISASVSKAIESEAAIFTPMWRRIHPSFLMKQAAGLAVAAAVGTIAVLSVQQTQLVSPDTTIATADSAQTSYQANPQNDQLRQVSFTTREKLDTAVESKLSGYLVNHNEFSKSIRVSGVMPYTRIVSFVPSEASQQVNNDK